MRKIVKRVNRLLNNKRKGKWRGGGRGLNNKMKGTRREQNFPINDRDKHG